MSGVTCQVSPVTCQVSNVILFSSSFWQIGEACRWRVCYQRGLPHLVNIPGVAGLFYKQLHHWLTEWLIDRVIDPFPPDLQITFPPKLKELESWNFDRMFTPHQVSHVRCQVSHILFLLQSGEASLWRVCYNIKTMIKSLLPLSNTHRH